MRIYFSNSFINLVTSSFKMNAKSADIGSVVASILNALTQDMVNCHLHEDDCTKHPWNLMNT